MGSVAAPDGAYLGAPPDRRWQGKPDVLYSELAGRARAHKATPAQVRAGKGWAWVVLPSGTMVAMRVRPDLDERLELRIARRGASDPAEWATWQSELSALLDGFQIDALDGDMPCRVPGVHWFLEPGEDRVPAAQLLQLRFGEVRPGKALCHVCLTERGELVEVTWWPPGGVLGQRCKSCARRAR